MFTNLVAARAQMGVSLVFHVIFSVLGVGLPLLLVMIAGPRDAAAAGEKKPAARKEKLAASVILAGLFLFFLFLTVLSSRRSGSG